MFSALRQGSTLYILEKGNAPTLRIGQCINTQNNFSTYLGNNNVDIQVKVDDETLDFKQLPGSLGLAIYNGNTVISDNKESMSQEVENMIRSSKQILESVPVHEKTIEEGEKILKQLSPHFAQQKEQEEKINNLESKVGNMESKLDNIASMLSKALNKQ